MHETSGKLLNHQQVCFCERVMLQPLTLGDTTKTEILGNSAYLLAMAVVGASILFEPGKSLVNP